MRDLQSPELEKHFLEFTSAHPDLSDKLGLWMADAATLELQDPEAAALFEKEFPELKG